jgi:hypothetical protein
LNLVTLLDMAASGNPDRVAVGRLRSTAEDAAPLSYPDLLDRARAGAGMLRERGATELVYPGVSGNAFAQALFAGRPRRPKDRRPQFLVSLSPHPPLPHSPPGKINLLCDVSIRFPNALSHNNFRLRRMAAACNRYQTDSYILWRSWH